MAIIHKTTLNNHVKHFTFQIFRTKIVLYFVFFSFAPIDLDYMYCMSKEFLETKYKTYIILQYIRLQEKKDQCGKELLPTSGKCEVSIDIF